jgi:hypothetical protein
MTKIAAKAVKTTAKAMKTTAKAAKTAMKTKPKRTVTATAMKFTVMKSLNTGVNATRKKTDVKINCADLTV